jgi:hypothetical protein
MIHGITPEIFVNNLNSWVLLKATPETHVSNTTIQYPIKIAHTIKKKGSNLDQYKGDSFDPAKIISVPREDWCIVGSNIPRATKINKTLFNFSSISSTLSILLIPGCFTSTGLNSIHKTHTYEAIQTATSNIGE